MYKLEYPIGSRDVDDIAPFIYNEIGKEDIVLSTRLRFPKGDYTNNIAVISSRTDAGECWMLCYYLKNSDHPEIKFIYYE